jgi:hypothetical protein
MYMMQKRLSVPNRAIKVRHMYGKQAMGLKVDGSGESEVR